MRWVKSTGAEPTDKETPLCSLRHQEDLRPAVAEGVSVSLEGKGYEVKTY